MGRFKKQGILPLPLAAALVCFAAWNGAARSRYTKVSFRYRNVLTQCVPLTYTWRRSGTGTQSPIRSTQCCWSGAGCSMRTTAVRGEQRLPPQPATAGLAPVQVDETLFSPLEFCLAQQETPASIAALPAACAYSRETASALPFCVFSKACIFLPPHGGGDPNTRNPSFCIHERRVPFYRLGEIGGAFPSVFAAAIPESWRGAAGAFSLRKTAAAEDTDTMDPTPGNKGGRPMRHRACRLPLEFFVTG